MNTYTFLGLFLIFFFLFMIFAVGWGVHIGIGEIWNKPQHSILPIPSATSTRGIAKTINATSADSWNTQPFELRIAKDRRMKCMKKKTEQCVLYIRPLLRLLQ